MATVISIVNQKGGVGKTTTAISLASYLAAVGCPTLLIDLDPQANATTGLGVDWTSIDKTIYECLHEDTAIGEVIQSTVIPGLSFVSSSIDLAGAEIELVSALARETRLRRALESQLPHYEFVIIDSPPSLGLLTVNSLAAADQVIVPVQCEFYALTGLAQLLKTLSLVRRSINPGLEILGVLLTMYDARTRLSEEVAAQLREHFKGRIFNTVIPRNIRLTEAPSHGQPVSLYAPDSRGAQAYRSLANEVLALTKTIHQSPIQEPDDGQTQARTGIVDSDGRMATPGRCPDGNGDRPDPVEPIPAPPECGSGAASRTDGVDPGPWGDPAAPGP